MRPKVEPGPDIPAKLARFDPYEWAGDDRTDRFSAWLDSRDA